VERLSEYDYAHNAEQRAIHEYRYRWALQFITEGDVVLDAACGIGYGRPILELVAGEWVGVDRTAPAAAFRADLTTDLVGMWDFDVFVGLETIEHLPTLEHYVELAKTASHTIVISTPIIPTVHFNPWHLHDFTRESLEALFVDGTWDVLEYEEQVDPTLGIPTYGLWAFR
jgi:hypothetical protein